MTKPNYTFKVSYRPPASGSNRRSFTASFSDYSQPRSSGAPGSVESPAASTVRFHIEDDEEVEESGPKVTENKNDNDVNAPEEMQPLTEQSQEDYWNYNYDWNYPPNSGELPVEEEPPNHEQDYPEQPAQPEQPEQPPADPAQYAEPDAGNYPYYGDSNANMNGDPNAPCMDNQGYDENVEAEPVHASPALKPVIAIIGKTGSGKTTFIKTVAGDKARHLVVGKNLHSCTQEVEKVTCTIGGVEVDLIDTPGFDDTELSDTEVLSRIADYLKYTYDDGILLTGMIYLHPISNNRMDGSAMKYLKVFRALCGDENLGNVILATTMWSKVSSSEGRQREADLKSNFWKVMVDFGSSVERVSKTHDRHKDKALIKKLLSKETVVLQLQHEMSQGKMLAETEVGTLLFEKLTRRVNELEQELEQAQEESQRAIKKGNKKVEDSFKEEIKKLTRKLKRMEDEKHQLRTRRPAHLPRNTRSFWRNLLDLRWECLDCFNKTRSSGVWKCRECGLKQNNTRY